ncbi:hypothetical protein Leryth_000488 [Lithospermum erythrorhizon]|nr:hypothetical protein Leryth_000488 [Lithospermum erythrorhizon]
METLTKVNGQYLTDSIQSHHFQIELELKLKSEERDGQKEEEIGCCKSSSDSSTNSHHGICAICLNKIVLQETALVKGCEHSYWFVFGQFQHKLLR